MSVQNTCEIDKRAKDLLLPSLVEMNRHVQIIVLLCWLLRHEKQFEM